MRETFLYPDEPKELAAIMAKQNQSESPEDAARSVEIQSQIIAHAYEMSLADATALMQAAMNTTTSTGETP